jgi:hypothetical protein
VQSVLSVFVSVRVVIWTGWTSTEVLWIVRV